MLTLPIIIDHLHIKEGYCHPDWAAITEIIEESFAESDWKEAWEAASQIWLKQMGDILGGNYQIYETPNFMILSEAPMHIMKDACRSCEQSLKRILVNFEGAVSDRKSRKHVVMMFSNLDHYYGYISYFYPEGENPMNGGVCLNGEGYVHFALPTTDYSSYRSVLVHELTHGCLRHLPIPIWLNEALAMRMEQVICGSAIIDIDQVVYDKHVAHWNAQTIQQFWTGKSWGIPGNSFELSYNLAQILWRKLETDLAAPRSKILRFISDAHFEDAGEAACRNVFDLSLGDLVKDFIGEGEWAPMPRNWPSNTSSQESKEVSTLR